MKKNLFIAVGLAIAGAASAQQADNIAHSRVPVKIVAVGNSITDGYGSSVREFSWPGHLETLMDSRYWVLNYGVSGTTMSREAEASYWKTWSYTLAKDAIPEILIIALGTNDCDPWRWNLYGKDFERDYRAMIQEFRDKGANPSLYFCLAPPKFPLNSGQNIITENEMIPKVKSLAAEYHAQLIDFHTLMYDRNDVFPDDIHPDDAGALVMAQLVKRRLEETQPMTFNFDISNGRVVDDRVAFINSGSNVKVTPSANGGSWLWEGPNGFRSTNRELSLNNVTSGGAYLVRHTTDQGYMEIDKILVTISGQRAGKITPAVKPDSNGGWTDNTSTLNVRPGDGFRLGPNCADGNDKVTWSWKGPNGFHSFNREIYIPVAYDATAGTYTVTVTDAQGRQNSQDFNVTVSGDRICPNVVCRVDLGGWKELDEVTLSGGGKLKLGPQPMYGGDWTWTGPNGFKAEGHTPMITKFNKDMAGVYTGVYTNGAGCREEVHLRVNFDCPKIIPYINYGGWKETAEVTVKRGDQISFGPQPSEGTWTWSRPDGTVTKGREFSVTVNENTAGIYNATLADDYGCVVEQTFIVKLEGVPSITPYILYDNEWKLTSNVTVQPGSEITFGPQPQDGDWTWTCPDGRTVNGREMKVVVNENTAGTYTATYRNGATVIQQKFYVNVVSCPEITPYVQYENDWKQVSELTVKPGSEITFGPHPLDGSWVWETPSGEMANGREYTVTIDQNTAGSYTATYMNTDGCQVEQEFNILLDNSATAVDKVKASESASKKDTWHDLQGRRVEQKNVSDGIYLHNDKKVIVK